MLAETNEIIYLSDIAVCRLMSLVRTRIQKIRRDKFCVSDGNHESKADKNILKLTRAKEFLASRKMQKVSQNK